MYGICVGRNCRLDAARWFHPSMIFSCSLVSSRSASASVAYHVELYLYFGGQGRRGEAGGGWRERKDVRGRHRSRHEERERENDCEWLEVHMRVDPQNLRVVLAGLSCSTHHPPPPHTSRVPQDDGPFIYRIS
jgi:hypothetical protein